VVISEIYSTILGESIDSGRPCVIVRLTGCHRRCTYCDSAHAFTGGREMSLDEVLAEVRAMACPVVLVTGGEPLLQTDSLTLMARLLEDGRHVVLETSGTLGPASLSDVPGGVRRVVDVKTPGSGIPAGEVDWEGLASLGPGDEVKFVCCDRGDYVWARDMIREGGRLPAASTITLSPAEGMLAPADLAGWIMEDRLDVRFQVQLHKAVWPDREQGI